MRAMSKRDSIYSVGNQIGVGKESGLLVLFCFTLSRPETYLQDIYVVADAEGHEMVLKLHRYLIFISILIEGAKNNPFLSWLASDVSHFAQ